MASIKTFPHKCSSFSVNEFLYFVCHSFCLETGLTYFIEGKVCSKSASSLQGKLFLWHFPVNSKTFEDSFDLYSSKNRGLNSYYRNISPDAERMAEVWICVCEKAYILITLKIKWYIVNNRKLLICRDSSGCVKINCLHVIKYQ